MTEAMNVFESNPELMRLVQERIRKQQEEEQRLSAQPPQPPQPDPPIPANTSSNDYVLELVPYVEETVDDGAKAKLKNYPITEAYRKWFSPKDMRDSGDGNWLTNCFNTNGHSNGDRTPSLCLKEGSNVYTCYGCGIRGDMVDLAATHAGLIPPGYEIPNHFIHEAVRFGCIQLFPEMESGFKQVGENNVWIYSPDPVIDFTQFEAPNIEEVEVDEPGKVVPTFDWENLLPQGSGIRRHMELTRKMGLPEEFGIPMWMALVSTIVGHDLKLVGRNSSQVCLFYILLVAPPNTGKSVSWNTTIKLLQEEMKYNPYDKDTRTFKVINEVSSGEILVQALDNWTKEEPNLAITAGGTPSKKKFTPEPQPNIRSILFYDEMETLISKINIKGSTLANKLTTAWVADGGILSEHTRNRASTDVTEYHMNLLTSTQNNKVGELVSPSNISSGFWSRWTFAFSERKISYYSDDMFNAQDFTVEDYIAEMRHHVRRLRQYIDSRVKLKDNKMTFEEEARKEFIRFGKEVVENYAGNHSNSLLNDLTIRAGTMFTRFIMFYSIALMEPVISLTAVRLAEHHFMVHIFNTEMVFDKLSDQTTEIRDYIEKIVIKRAATVDKNGEPNPLRHIEILRYVRDKYKGRISEDGINRIIDNMVRGGTLQKVDINQGKQSKIGRPKAIRYIPSD